MVLGCRIRRHVLAWAGSGTARSRHHSGDPWPRVVDLVDRAGARLPAADQHVDRQPARLPRRDGATRRTRRRTRTSASCSRRRARRSTGSLRTVVFEDLQISKIDFPTLPDRGASFAPELTQGVRGARCARCRSTSLQASLAANGVKPATVEVANNAAAGHREQLAGDPGADRRRTGDEAGARQLALPARHQHARAHPAGRPRATTSTSTSTTAGSRRARSRAVDAVARASRSAMDDVATQLAEERTRSTC